MGATEKGRTVFQMRQFQNHKVLEQYRALTNEIEWRIIHRGDFLAGGQYEFDMSSAANADPPHELAAQE
jgi:hypothetical protein